MCYNTILLTIKYRSNNMPRYRVNYTADVWESVIVEADSKEQAKTLFDRDWET